MGPSGAGKSSLLNVLAGRSSSRGNVKISGTVTVGGKKIDPVAFRKNIAYVMQDDSLLATATPREALFFSASMRLPSHYTKKQLNDLVDSTLTDLGLDVCADVLIGGALIKGISGGQRKRTSVGVEIITSPNLLFLDEPTSGLDSYSAHSLITLLKNQICKTATILCTIHQPSSEIFCLFDSVIFVRAGQIFYQGPVSTITSHFAKFDHISPPGYNPSDFIMNLSQIVTDEEVEKKGMIMAPPVDLSDNSTSVKFSSKIVFKSESSFFKQVIYLTHRETVNTVRDVGALFSRIGVTVILFLLFGLIFMDAGSGDNADNEKLTSHFGSVTMVMVSCMFGIAQPVMLSFPYERPMFLREYSTGTYNALAYFLSKLFVEIPVVFIQTVVQYLICYWLIDFQGQFFWIVLTSWGLGMAASSVAVFLGCIVGDVKTVTELAPMLFVPQLLFVGFFIRTSQIPVFLRWAQYLCSLKYAMNLIIMTEFRATSESCSKDPIAYNNCKQLIEANNIIPDQVWLYIILIFFLFAGFRIVGMAILTHNAKRFY